MTVFADTSALYALLDADDANRERAIETLTEIRGSQRPLLTHSYVLVETTALLQRRIGLQAVAALHDDLLPGFEVAWVGEELHVAAWTALRAARRRQVSLVDHVSFELMHRRAVRAAFAFDDDFERAGFELL